MNYFIVLRSITLFLFSLWFGGFLFYSSIVISNAHAVVGDHETVGMITQRVTGILNLIGVPTIGFLFLNLIQEKKKLPGNKLKVSLILLSVITCCLIALFIFHTLMSQYIDPVKLELSEHKKFYRLHRVYLIISTVQFFSLVAYIPSFIKSLSPGGHKSH